MYRGMTRAWVLSGLLGLMAGCGGRPYRAFSVQIAKAPPPDSAATSMDGSAAPGASARSFADRGVGAAGARLRAEMVPVRSQPWDLNQVSAATLATLPGIDQATVAAIIAGRPYKAKRDLLKRKILTSAEYARWKSYLVVHRHATKRAQASTAGDTGEEAG